MQCPKCQSGDIARAAVVFEQETRRVTTTTTGMGVGLRGGIGVGVGASTGTQQTRFASRCRPPAKKKMVIPGVGFFIAVIVVVVIMSSIKNIAILNLVGFLVAIIGGVGLIIRNTVFNLKTWPQLYDQWQQSWVCRSCGASFIPRGGSSGVMPAVSLTL